MNFPNYIHQEGRAKKLGIRFMFEVDPSSSMLLAFYVLICWLQTAAEQLHVPGYQAFKRRCRVHDFEDERLQLLNRFFLTEKNGIGLSFIRFTRGFWKKYTVDYLIGLNRVSAGK